jgi:DNA invertase Pin-like site-specific DNA recombinase
MNYSSILERVRERPEFQRMLAYCRKHRREVSHVLVAEKLTTESRKARAGTKWYEKQVARILNRS